MPPISRRDVLQLLGCAPIGAGKRLQMQSELERAIDRDPALASAFAGAAVVRLSDGKLIFERNSERLFTPASNSKLFTTALALTRLGPDYRFITTIAAEGDDLVLFGGGDPSMSGRVYPYTKEPSQGDPLQAIEDLADQVAARGERSVTGNVIGDDSRYPWAPYPAGWSIGDMTSGYGAPVSALVVSDNEMRLSIAPGDAEGALAQLSLSPAVEYFEVDNRVETTAGSTSSVHVERDPGSTQVRLWGSIGLGAPAVVQRLAIPQPALFAAVALREALIRRGIAVHGESVARHRWMDEANPTGGGVELARRTSPPLMQLVQAMDKASQNLHAELLLREVGVVRRGIGTTGAGLAEMKDLLAEAQIPDEQVVLRDGSGLSRDSLVTPAAIVKLLEYLHGSAVGSQFATLMPVGGEDGTLQERFKHHPEANKLQAKTGTLSGVRALSGYAESREYGLVAFSILVNHAKLKPDQFAKILDNIGLKLLL